jgi:RNA polymerase sigma factor (TIGR02999 family)
MRVLPFPVTRRNAVTGLLQVSFDGDAGARQELMSAVYSELRRHAAAQLRRERPGHTLQPTALVHDTYLRVVDQTRIGWVNRGQFFAIATPMMRRILVDHARAARMPKRAGGKRRVILDETIADLRGRDVDILDLERALSVMAKRDPRKCQVAELRMLAGLSQAEVAAALGVSGPTVERDWTAASAWIYAELTRNPEDRVR